VSAPLQAREITFGHVGGPDSLFADSAEHFAELVNERLPEPYEVVVFGSSQLGTDSELLQRMRLGTVDLALPSTIMSSVADEFGLFELPYLIQDREHMKRVEESRRRSSGRTWRRWPSRTAIGSSPSGRTASAISPTTCARSTPPRTCAG